MIHLIGRFQFVLCLCVASLLGASSLLSQESSTSTSSNECPFCKMIDCGCAHCSTRPDGQAPVGVMGDHTHEKGGGMLSYRYMRMDMRPNYSGDSEVSPRSFIGPGQAFRIAPLSMQTEMHMLGAMYAPSSDITLTFMLPTLDKKMDHLVANGSTFTTRSSGIGDFRFGGLVDVFEKGTTHVHANVVISAPTGSITETGFVPPAGRVIRLPYPMQLGSGTWDLHPGITYTDRSGRLSWGAQLMTTLRLGRNDQGYSLGNEIQTTAWAAYQLSDQLSTSLRLGGKTWGDVNGRDAQIRGPVPTARPDLRGGTRLDAFWGLNYLFTGGQLNGHRIGLEVGRELYQHLDGPQLGMDWMFQVGWQKAF